MSGGGQNLAKAKAQGRTSLVQGAGVRGVEVCRRRALRARSPGSEYAAEYSGGWARGQKEPT